MNLREYTDFCLKHSESSYFVSLDVIPGAFKTPRSITKIGIEETCKRGWLNYRSMIGELPREKVIPVFHQNDDPKWLAKYLDFGVTYVGVSPANDRGTRDKRAWMRSIRGFLFDSAGRPAVRTHGFAVTCSQLLNYWRWHSVDSATWKQMASWGIVLLPDKKGAGYDYSAPFRMMFVSESSPHRKRRNIHHASASPVVRDRLAECLSHYGMKFGTSDVVKVPPDYKLRFRTSHGVAVGEGETWHDRERGLILRPVEVGVSNSFRERCRFNLYFAKGQERDCPVDHLYLAGAPTPYKFETKLGCRLLSYDVVKKPSSEKRLVEHLESMREYQ